MIGEAVLRAGALIAAANRRLGNWVAWLALAMMLLQVALVVLRSVFSIGSIWLTELIVFANAIMIAAAIASTWAVDGHTRIDVLRERQSPLARRRTDRWCTALLLLPAAAWLIWVSLPYAISAWQTLEGSRNVGGLPGFFIIKSLPLVIGVLLLLQAFAVLLGARTLAREDDEKGGVQKARGEAP